MSDSEEEEKKASAPEERNETGLCFNGTKIKGKLGKGGFGDVYDVKIQSMDRMPYGRKPNPDRGLVCKVQYFYDKEEFQKALQETKVLVELKGKGHTIKYIGTAVGKTDKQITLYTFIEKSNLGDLLQFQNARKRNLFTAKEAQFIIKQVISGLRTLHKKKIEHGDLKRGNVLVHCPDLDEII